MGVADDHGARAEQIVHVFVAAHVPHAPGAPCGNDDLMGDVAEIARGQDAPGKRDQLALGFGGPFLRHGPFSSLARASPNASARSPPAATQIRCAVPTYLCANFRRARPFSQPATWGRLRMPKEPVVRPCSI